MNICTFGKVIAIITEYINEDALTQYDLMVGLFYSFYEDNAEYTFENSTVNKWIKGVLPVTSVIRKYYQIKDNSENLGVDFENHIYTHIIDMDMMIQKLYEMVMSDNSISDGKKAEICSGFPFENDTQKCDFVGRIISFVVDRKQYSNDAVISLL